MNHKMTNVSLFLWALALNSIVFAQGPIDGFLKGKNVLDIAVSGGIQKADVYLGGKGPFNYSREFGQGSVFMEYGVTNRFDLVATVPFVGEKLQDAAVFGKGKFLSLFNNKLDFLAAGGVSFPASKYPTESGLAIGQQATQLQGKLVIQAVLPKGVYFQVQSGYHYALDPVPSAVVVSSKLMWTPGKWYLDAWINYQNGLGNKVYLGNVPFSSFRELVVDYSQFGGTIYRSFSSSIGGFLNGSYIFSGLGTFKTYAFGGGMTYKFQFKKKVSTTE